MLGQSREIDIAWAAGLFEGEGCINTYARKNGTMQMQIRLGMTDLDVVERFMLIVGCGSISLTDSPAHQEKGWKPCHTWVVYEAEKVREVTTLLLPFLHGRRHAKALEVLELGKDVKPHASKTTHCPQGHAYEGDNVVTEMVGTGKSRHLARRCKTCRNEQARERARKRLGITPDRYRIKEAT